MSQPPTPPVQTERGQQVMLSTIENCVIFARRKAFDVNQNTSTDHLDLLRSSVVLNIPNDLMVREFGRFYQQTGIDPERANVAFEVTVTGTLNTTCTFNVLDRPAISPRITIGVQQMRVQRYLYPIPA